MDFLRIALKNSFLTPTRCGKNPSRWHRDWKSTKKQCLYLQKKRPVFCLFIRHEVFQSANFFCWLKSTGANSACMPFFFALFNQNKLDQTQKKNKANWNEQIKFRTFVSIFAISRTAITIPQIAIRTVDGPIAGKIHKIQKNIFVYIQKWHVKTVHTWVIYDQLHGHFIANTRFRHTDDNNNGLDEEKTVGISIKTTIRRITCGQLIDKHAKCEHFRNYDCLDRKCLWNCIRFMFFSGMYAAVFVVVVLVGFFSVHFLLRKIINNMWFVIEIEGNEWERKTQQHFPSVCAHDILTDSRISTRLINTLSIFIKEWKKRMFSIEKVLWYE